MCAVAATVIVLGTCLASPGQGESIVPEPLRAFRVARTSLRSGVVQWTATLPSTGRKLHYVSRYARNGDLIFEERGDEKGFTRWNAAGYGISRFPYLWLRKHDGTVWRYRDTTGVAHVIPPDTPIERRPPISIRDARAIGLFSTSKSIELPLGGADAWVGSKDVVVEYHTQREGSYHIVEGVHASGAKTTWTIDPERGWNALRIVSEYQGVDARGHKKLVRTEVINELARFGNVRFPARTTYLRDGEIEAVIEVTEARFNRPDDPAAFSPNDIHVEPGVNITIATAEPGSRIKVWNGEAISDPDVFWQEVQAGLREPGPLFKQLQQRGYWDSPYLSDAERRRLAVEAAKRYVEHGVRDYKLLWRQYVNQFIQRYKLDAEQAQKAFVILAECEDRAEPIAQRIERRFAELARELKKAAQRSDSDRIRQLRDAMAKLKEPITQIFERRLKPGLEKLPRRSQRAAAGDSTP